MTDNARKFDGLAELYDMSRPRYPAEALATIVEAVAAVNVPPRCIDVGAGTGISTRALIDALPHWTTLAVEPNEDMASRARSIGIEVVTAPAEALPIEAGTIGLVTVAQAFHWFDRPAFLAEADRVLVPGGVLAIINNNRQTANSPVLMAVEDFLERENPSYARNYRDLDIVKDIVDAGRFSDVKHVGHPWVLAANSDSLARYFLSRSSAPPIVARLGEVEAKARLTAVIERHAGGGPFDVPMVCDVIFARRR